MCFCYVHPEIPMVQNGANKLRIQADQSTRHCQTYWETHCMILLLLRSLTLSDWEVNKTLCRLCVNYLFCEIPSFLNTLLWGMFSSLCGCFFVCFFSFHTQGAPNKLNSRKYDCSVGGLQPSDEHKLQHFNLFKEMGRYQQPPKTLHHKRPLEFMGNLLKN